MRILLVTVILLSCAVTFSQTLNISGKVIDKTTKSPLQAASVYAQNTTFGIATGAEGNFTLKLPAGGYELIVTFTGYETETMRVTAANANDFLTIELKPKEKSLEEVSVVASTEVKDGWQKYGAFFTENFIGKTDYSKQTEIKNPEVLKFYYSKKRNRLKVVSNEPSVIVNNALGYTIKYAIDSFTYEYGTNTNTITGYPLFEEMKGTPEQEKVWKENRAKTYKGSMLHFMRSLYNQTLSQQGFEVQNAAGESYVPVKNVYAAWKYTRDDSAHTVQFTPNNPDIAIIYTKAPPEASYLAFDPAAKKDYRVSTVHFVPGAEFTIESNGYYYDQSDVLVNGYWGFEKVANMMPYDYSPQ